MTNSVNKRYNRNLISSEDFFEAVDYLKALADHQTDKIVLRALLTAATISYCRPFTNNSGDRNNAIPSVSQKFVNMLEHNEKKLHEKLMTLRHKVLAHSDFDAKPCQRAPEGTTLMKEIDILGEDINIDLFLKLAGGMAAKCMRENKALDRDYPL